MSDHAERATSPDRHPVEPGGPTIVARIESVARSQPLLAAAAALVGGVIAGRLLAAVLAPRPRRRR